MYPVLCIFDVLSVRIDTCPSSILLPTLRALRQGLNVWLSVEEGVVNKDDYESKVSGNYLTYDCNLSHEN